MGSGNTLFQKYSVFISIYTAAPIRENYVQVCTSKKMLIKERKSLVRLNAHVIQTAQCIHSEVHCEVFIILQLN